MQSRNRKTKKHMVATQHKNTTMNGHSIRKPQKMTMVSYFESLRQSFFDQFIAAPFKLDERNALRCAKKVIRVIQRNHSEAKGDGLLD